MNEGGRRKRGSGLLRAKWMAGEEIGKGYSFYVNIGTQNAQDFCLF